MTNILKNKRLNNKYKIKLIENYTINIVYSIFALLIQFIYMKTKTNI